MDKSRFISACAQGGRVLNEVLADLGKVHLGRLLNDARQSLPARHHDMASDLVQQTFIKAWLQCHTFRGDASVLTWLFAILRRSIVDHLRQLRPEVPLLDAEDRVSLEVERALGAAHAGPALDPRQVTESAELQSLYEACFARFAAADPEAAAVVRWIAQDELKIEEIAAILGRTPGATRTFLSKSRKKARFHLAPWYAQVCSHREKIPT